MTPLITSLTRLAGSVRLLAVFILLLPLASRAEESSSLPVLSSVIRVELTDGRIHSGRPVSFRDDILVLRSRLDSGDVERGFPRERIARIHFSGQEVAGRAAELLQAGEVAQALPYLEALWRQRGSLLSLLEPEDIDLLAALPGVHLATENPYRAIGLANTILPHAANTATLVRLHETVLLAHYRLGFYPEAEKLARAWIQQQAEPPLSALGWKVLADLALKEEDFDSVIWIALQPVALGGPGPISYLDDCYALAIHAFHLQDEQERAGRLYREMIERDLSWPPDPVLAATGDFYQAENERATKTKPPAAEPDLDLRPPEEDLNLPVRQVRKLLHGESP